MNAIRRADLLAFLLLALALSAIFASPPLDRLRGLSIDTLTWLRWKTFGQLHAPAQSPTVVVALDEETFRTPPFNRTPTVTWTNELAGIVNALLDGGAKVVGFDVIYPISIEQSDIPFGEETVGARLRGFDREFLRALATGARAGKLLLGQVQHQDHPIRPSDAQRIAVGHGRNIRALNFHTDADDIVRRVPLTFNVDGQPVPSMAVELAARALGVTPAIDQAGVLTLGPNRIGSNIPNTLTLNFDGGADDIPTYSLADLRACVKRGEADYFKKNFSGRVVLIGTVLDIEDRKVASKRFATGNEGARAERCVLPAAPEGVRFARDSVAGVYIHATAVNNLIRGDSLQEPTRMGTAATMLIAASAAGALALVVASGLALFVLVGALIVWTAVAILTFEYAQVVPFIDTVAATIIAFAAITGYRAAIVDRDKRFLRKSFALYLPPAVIDAMLKSNKPPSLGGEMRDVTVYFSDVAGFSSLSEGLSPPELVALMNAYLSSMTDIIEAHGGFVDKYIGDAIAAVFGAPVDEPDHAFRAVTAALACNARLAEMNRSALPAFKSHSLGQRIGLNSGPALIGNIGSRQRFNYTAMGDVVNLASRLEGANKVYGTEIIAAQATRDRAGDAILWRELDAVRVVGIAKPVEIFEPLGLLGDGALPEMAETYAQGLKCWRARDFAGAARAFAANAGTDAPSQRFLERAAKFVSRPPEEPWDPVNNLESK